MINNLFSPTGGSGGLALAGLELTSVDIAADKAVVAHVRAASKASLECPDCRARRHVTGTRITRFKDIPRDGHPVVLSWRRRHFACTSCHRPSHENVGGVEERHRVTTRLVDWVWQQAGETTFMGLARRCGLSQRTVIALFQVAKLRNTQVWPNWPYNLGLNLVQIAGLPRPVLLDSANGAVVEVYRSLERFESVLMVDSEATSHRLILDLRLHEIDSLLRGACILDRFLMSPQSISGYAAELMTRAAGEAIGAQASKEGKAAKTRLIVFSRRRDDLGRIGLRQLRDWSKNAPQIADAYDFKERLLTLCNSWRLRGWLDWKQAWKERTTGWPKNDDASTTVDYAGVIALIDQYAEAITGYQDRVATGEFRNYEKTLASLAALAPTGARFAGTRAAILQKFGQRPDSGDGEKSGER